MVGIFREGTNVHNLNIDMQVEVILMDNSQINIMHFNVSFRYTTNEHIENGKVQVTLTLHRN